MHALPQPAAASTASTPGWLGDLLLTFNANAPTAGRTDTSWQRAAGAEGWELYTQLSGPGWRGFPASAGETGAWRYWFLGELYGSGRLNTAVAQVLHGRMSESALNGQFLLLAWHELAREWHIWTDRFGTLHVYVASDGPRTAVGTWSPAVAQAASRRRLDWDGLAGFFSLGFFTGDRTHYRDLRIVRPATHLVLDDHGRVKRERRTWAWHHAPEHGRSFNDTVAAFAACLQSVVKDHTRDGRVAVPISGGLDSRSLVAALGPQAVQAYSYGYTSDSVETRIAARIARAAELPFHGFTTPAYLFDSLERVTAQVEGFQDVTQSRQAGIIDHLAGQTDAILGGHLGDLWLDAVGIAPEAGPDSVLSKALSKMQKAGRGWLEAHLLQPQLASRQPDSLVRAQIAAELERLDAIADPDYRLKALKTDQWVFRWTNASLRAFQPAAFVRLPFYDTRLADFISTVPVEMLAGRRLQIAYLQRCAPDLARITWQQFDADLFHYQQFNTWQLPRRAAKKAWRLLTRRRVLERNWEVQFLHAHGRAGLTNWLLRPGIRLHSFVDPQAVQQLLADFFADPLGAGRGYTVSMLLTFSAWLEMGAD